MTRKYCRSELDGLRSDQYYDYDSTRDRCTGLDQTKWPNPRLRSIYTLSCGDETGVSALMFETRIRCGELPGAVTRCSRRSPRSAPKSGDDEREVDAE